MKCKPRRVRDADLVEYSVRPRLDEFSDMALGRAA